MTPKYVICIRRYDCHPETCAHEEHHPWWLWDDRAKYWYLGFDSKTDASDFCEKMGHSYIYESDLQRAYDPI